MTNDTTKDNGRQVQKVEPETLLGNETVYLCRHNERFAQATYLEKKPKGGQGRMPATHEKKQVANIRRSMKRLTAIIRRNFGYDSEREAHITLTYKGTMTDKDRLYNDFCRWFKRLRRGYPDHNFDYVAVMEPHGKGGWHIHLLLKSDQPLWRANRVNGLDFDRVREMWRAANGSGNGGTRHERMPMSDEVKDLGSYFAAYFTTIIPEDVEATGDRTAIKEASKAAIKGSRIKFYPAGFRFYRCSLGIDIPKPEKEPYRKALEDYGNPTYQAAYEVTREDKPDELMQYIQVFDFDTKKICNDTKVEA
jgi:hypothetical protein